MILVLLFQWPQLQHGGSDGETTNNGGSHAGLARSGGSVVGVGGLGGIGSARLLGRVRGGRTTRGGSGIRAGSGRATDGARNADALGGADLRGEVDGGALVFLVAGAGLGQAAGDVADERLVLADALGVGAAVADAAGEELAGTVLLEGCQRPRSVPQFRRERRESWQCQGTTVSGQTVMVALGANWFAVGSSAETLKTNSQRKWAAGQAGRQRGLRGLRRRKWRRSSY
jgi:hypothetical protein